MGTERERPLIAVRVCPVRESEAGVSPAVSVCLHPPKVLVQLPGTSDTEKHLDEFAVDRVFAPEFLANEQEDVSLLDSLATGQDDVYVQLCESLLDQTLQGVNACLVAFGEAGSGKTYSIFGQESAGSDHTCSMNTSGMAVLEDMGLVQRAGHELLRLRPAGGRVWCSWMEVQDGRLVDLLQPIDSPSRSHLRAYASPKGVCVPQLTESDVQTSEDVHRLIRYGKLHHTISCRQLQPAKRSQMVFSYLYERSVDVQQPEKVLRGRLSFVDCSGLGMGFGDSKKGVEKWQDLHAAIHGLTASGASNNVNESSSIEHSMATRGGLNSTLFGAMHGNGAKLAVLATVSAAAANVQSTLTTLKAAASFKEVTFMAKPNMVNPEQELWRLLGDVQRLRHRLFATVPGRMIAGLMREDEDSMRANIVRVNDAHLESADRTEQLLQACEKNFAELGIVVSSERLRIHQQLQQPYFTNISEDPMFSGCIVFLVWPTSTVTIGSATGNGAVLQGLGMAEQHCSIRCEQQEDTWMVQVTNCDPTLNRVTVSRQGLSPTLAVEQEPVTINDKDCLTVGRAWALRAVVPRLTEESVLDVTVEEGMEAGACWTVEDGLLESAWGTCSTSLEGALKKATLRLKPEGVSSDHERCLIAALQALCPLIDDANALTDILRPQEGLRFELATCAATLDPLEGIDAADVPAVRLLQQKAPGSKRHVIGLWTANKFKGRLLLMRKLYDDSCGTLPELQALQQLWRGDILCDPWGEVSLASVAWHTVRSNWLADMMASEAAEEALGCEAPTSKGASCATSSEDHDKLRGRNGLPVSATGSARSETTGRIEPSTNSDTVSCSTSRDGSSTAGRDGPSTGGRSGRELVKGAGRGRGSGWAAPVVGRGLGPFATRGAGRPPPVAKKSAQSKPMSRSSSTGSEKSSHNFRSGTPGYAPNSTPVKKFSSPLMPPRPPPPPPSPTLEAPRSPPSSPDRRYSPPRRPPMIQPNNSTYWGAAGLRGNSLGEQPLLQQSIAALNGVAVDLRSEREACHGLPLDEQDRVIARLDAENSHLQRLIKILQEKAEDMNVATIKREIEQLDAKVDSLRSIQSSDRSDYVNKPDEGNHYMDLSLYDRGANS